MSHLISSDADISKLFEIPFVPKKYLFSQGSSFLKEANDACRVYRRQLIIDEDDGSLLHKIVPKFKCGDRSCVATFDTVHAYEMHYSGCHKNSCLECRRTFPTVYWLDCHIQEKHDSYDQAVKEKGALFDCPLPGCEENFASMEKRKDHLTITHKYPKNFKYLDLRQKFYDDRMDTSQGDSVCSGNKPPLEKKYVSRVPNSICFGKQAVRGFQHTKKKRVDKNTKDITMRELQEALN